MMGVNHATTGAAAWVAVTAVVPGWTTGWYPVDATGVFAGAIVCAGAALLPDADHHNGTIARSVPGIGTAVTSAIGHAAGGHRHGLHSILGILGAAFGAFLLDYIKLPTDWHGTLPIGAGLATMALTAFAARALKLTRGNWVMPWILGALVAAFIVFFAPSNLIWLPLAIILGYIVHLLGDALTVGGIAWLWPFHPKPPLLVSSVPVLNSIWMDNGYFALPVLGKTGSVREWLFGAAIGVYVVWVLVCVAFAAFGLNLIDLLTTK
jgi:membrane-bound metal-dependent hydrolase YbcI (DUF457 family)